MLSRLKKNVERQIALDPFRLAQAEQKAHPAAPIVRHQPDVVEIERIQQCDNVVHQLFLLVARGRSLRPAEAAQVGTNEGIALRQWRDLIAPHLPVLRPAMQHQQRLTVSRLGQMQIHAVGVDEAMGDAVNGWE